MRLRGRSAPAERRKERRWGTADHAGACNTSEGALSAKPVGGGVVASPPGLGWAGCWWVGTIGPAPFGGLEVGPSGFFEGRWAVGVMRSICEWVGNLSWREGEPGEGLGGR
jgi:hypothetical protein